MTSTKLLLARYSHAILFGSLVLVVGVQPFFYGAVFGTDVIRASLFFSLIVSGFSCAANRKQVVGFLILAIPTVVVGVIWWSTASDATEKAYYTLSAITSLYVVVLILLEIFRSTGVTVNTILGALSVYMMMGVLWTYVYVVMLSFDHTSFSFGLRGAPQSGVDELKNLLGFSFTTLTTLGYGNIIPMTPKADALTTMQAITGQIYLTVLVARLVGIQVSQHIARHSHNA